MSTGNGKTHKEATQESKHHGAEKIISPSITRVASTASKSPSSTKSRNLLNHTELSTTPSQVSPAHSNISIVSANQPSTETNHSTQVFPTSILPNPGGIFFSLKRRLRRLLGSSPPESTEIHKSLQSIEISSHSSHSYRETRKASSTGNNIREYALGHTGGGYVTSDVPDDVSGPKKEYEEALIELTSLTDKQVHDVRASWSLLKTHIEKIGVIVFLGLFEEHSDFRDAFARYRGKQLMDITRDPTLQAHGLRVLNVVDKLIGRLHKVGAIHDFILSLGSKHCRYVPSITLIPNVGEQIIEAVHPVLEENGLWNEDTEYGWQVTMTFLTSAMKYGLCRTPRA